MRTDRRTDRHEANSIFSQLCEGVWQKETRNLCLGIHINTLRKPKWPKQNVLAVHQKIRSNWHAHCGCDYSTVTHTEQECEYKRILDELRIYRSDGSFRTPLDTNKTLQRKNLETKTFAILNEFFSHVRFACLLLYFLFHLKVQRLENT